MRCWLDPAFPPRSSKSSNAHLNTLKCRNFESRLYLDRTRSTAGSIGSAIRAGLIRAGRYSSTGQRVTCIKTNMTPLREWALKGELRPGEAPCAHGLAVTTISRATNFLRYARRSGTKASTCSFLCPTSPSRLSKSLPSSSTGRGRSGRETLRRSGGKPYLNFTRKFAGQFWPLMVANCLKRTYMAF